MTTISAISSTDAIDVLERETKSYRHYGPGFNRTIAERFSRVQKSHEICRDSAIVDLLLSLSAPNVFDSFFSRSMENWGDELVGLSVKTYCINPDHTYWANGNVWLAACSSEEHGFTVFSTEERSFRLIRFENSKGEWKLSFFFRREVGEEVQGLLNEAAG